MGVTEIDADQSNNVGFFLSCVFLFLSQNRVDLGRDGIFWLPAGKDATERLPWLLEHLAVQLVVSCGGSGDSRAPRPGVPGGRGKQVRYVMMGRFCIVFFVGCHKIRAHGMEWNGMSATKGNIGISWANEDAEPGDTVIVSIVVLLVQVVH